MLITSLIHYRVSLSVFRQTDRFDLSSFQTKNMGYMFDFSVHTMLGVDVSVAVIKMNILSNDLPPLAAHTFAAI